MTERVNDEVENWGGVGQLNPVQLAQNRLMKSDILPLQSDYLFEFQQLLMVDNIFKI